MLGLMGYLVQGHVARTSAKAERETDRRNQDRDKEQASKKVLLERVQLQMEVYQGLRAAQLSADMTIIYMTWELGFEWFDKFGYEIVRPSEGAWPHIDVLSRALPWSFKTMQDSGSPWLKYSARDIEVWCITQNSSPIHSCPRNWLCRGV